MRYIKTFNESIDEDKQMYIDIISMDPNNSKYQK